MKPVAIFRHVDIEGPGHFATFLDQHAIPWQMIRIDQGEEVPAAANAIAGIVLMGGTMSVNDDLPWIPPALALIRDAYALNIPLLGHCLGAQLMAKALGGVVTKNPVQEIGWDEVVVADNETARLWFGKTERFDAFHWHGETFSLPAAAVHLLSSANCRNQAYAIGKHLGLQCHVEMTAQMIRAWCDAAADELSVSPGSPAVQSAQTMQAQMHDKLPHLHHVATQLYSHWLRGLVH